MPADKQLRFATLTKVSRELLKIVAIDLEEGDNAQVIFETLNARGTPLLAIDLVKNLVFQRAMFPEQTWTPCIRSTGRLSMSRHGAKRFDKADSTDRAPKCSSCTGTTMQRAEEVGAHHLFPTFRRLLDDPASPGITDVVREFAADARTFRSFDTQPSGSVEQRFFQRLEILDTTTG